MNDLQLFTNISALPNSLNDEAADFVEFLKQKAQKNKEIKERTFGYAKGFFTMSADLMSH